MLESAGSDRKADGYTTTDNATAAEEDPGKSLAIPILRKRYGLSRERARLIAELAGLGERDGE